MPDGWITHPTQRFCHATLRLHLWCKFHRFWDSEASVFSSSAEFLVQPVTGMLPFVTVRSSTCRYTVMLSGRLTSIVIDMLDCFAVGVVLTLGIRIGTRSVIESENGFSIWRHRHYSRGYVPGEVLETSKRQLHGFHPTIHSKFR